MVQRESRSSTIGHITLGMKQTGAPSAGNPHAGCDVAGAGNEFTVWLLRHSQRKRGETDRPDLRNTAPVLDPTPSHLRCGVGATDENRQFSSAPMDLSVPCVPPSSLLTQHAVVNRVNRTPIIRRECQKTSDPPIGWDCLTK